MGLAGLLKGVGAEAELIHVDPDQPQVQRPCDFFYSRVGYLFRQDRIARPRRLDEGSAAARVRGRFCRARAAP